MALGTPTWISTAATLGQKAVVDVYLQKKFIEELRKRLIITPLGVEADLPTSSGSKVRWLLFGNPTTATGITPITEGTDPTEDASITLSGIESTLQEYGNYVQYSKFLKLVAINGTIDRLARGMAYKAKLIIDTLTFDTLEGAATTRDAGAAMSANFLLGQVRALVEADVMPHPTSPSGSDFVYVCTAEQAFDMMGEGNPAWYQVKDTQHPAMVNPMKGDVASSALYGAIVRISTNAPTVASEDYSYLLGDEAFGTVSLDSNLMDPTIIHTRPDENIPAPARNRGVLAFWFLYASKLIDEVRFREIKSDVG